MKSLFYFKSSFLFFIFLTLSSFTSISARKFSPELLPLGAVVKIGDRKLIKITLTGKFVDSKKWATLGNTTMQGWDDCATLATPAGTNFTQGPTLIDARDNKQYEIRKFADGKCWMINNLMYGGDTDACAGKTTFNGNGAVAPSNQFGPNTYGDCRDAAVGANSAYCATGARAGECGYYYNWQAAMQHSSAYYGVNYTGSTVNVQGICPEGWFLPTNSGDGSYRALHDAIGLVDSFWFDKNRWNGDYYGWSNPNGAINYQNNNHGFFWSSDSVNNNIGSSLLLHSARSYPEYNSYDKNYGFSVRCLKD